jgi:hypothetical protein
MDQIGFNDGLSNMYVFIINQPTNLIDPSGYKDERPTANPYDPKIEDGTGHMGYNPGKIIVPKNFHRDEILILPEHDSGKKGLLKVPPNKNGDTIFSGDAVYLRPGPGNNPGIIKVPDGHTIAVIQNENGSWSWSHVAKQRGFAAGLIKPRVITSQETGFPQNPLPANEIDPPNKQP